MTSSLTPGDLAETIFISATDKLWKVHTEKTSIGEGYILKSTAITAAIKYISKLPQGNCSEIKIQWSTGKYYIYWSLNVDAYPPQKKPYRLRKVSSV